jgi:hypothetical protein
MKRRYLEERIDVLISQQGRENSKLAKEITQLVYETKDDDLINAYETVLYNIHDNYRIEGFLERLQKAGNNLSSLKLKSEPKPSRKKPGLIARVSAVRKWTEHRKRKKSKPVNKSTMYKWLNDGEKSRDLKGRTFEGVRYYTLKSFKAYMKSKD